MRSDGSDHWQAAGNRGGAEILEPRTSSYCQQSLLSPFSLVQFIVEVLSVFWVFGSLFKSLRRHSGLLLRQ